MNEVLIKIRELLNAGESLVLATILSQKGSTPRLPGAKMIIRADGSSIGTIGGGIVEAEIINAAPEVFASSDAQLRNFDLAGNDVAPSIDMICGGAIDILIDLLPPTSSNQVLFEKLCTPAEPTDKYHLITTLEEEDTGRIHSTRCLVENNKVVEGTFAYAGAWLETLIHECGISRFPVLVTIEDRRFFVERYALPETVYLFGAGHVSRKVAELAAFVDFSIVVLDDREEFANQARFPQADRIVVVPSFGEAFATLHISEGSYIVIVTRGHAHDKTVLAQALKTGAGYIGMIGSRKKRDTIYQALLKEGLTNRDIERVHCPIGLPIGGETPEEIAVSIVAELIQARTKGRKKS